MTSITQIPGILAAHVTHAEGGTGYTLSARRYGRGGRTRRSASHT